jgi:hypothetical protein
MSFRPNSKLYRFFAATPLLLLFVLRGARAAEVVDRIVASVNGQIISLSDWEQEIAFESLRDTRPLTEVSSKQKDEALHHLIDQELLRQQTARVEAQPASVQEIDEQLAQIRALYPAASSEEGWQAVLSAHQMTEEELKNHIHAQLDLLRLVDARLRPTVHVDGRSIESYYRDRFVPQLKKEGAAPPPLEQVRPKITEILLQQKIDESLNTWLTSLRASGEITIADPSSALPEKQ